MVEKEILSYTAEPWSVRERIRQWRKERCGSLEFFAKRYGTDTQDSLLLVHVMPLSLADISDHIDSYFAGHRFLPVPLADTGNHRINVDGPSWLARGGSDGHSTAAFTQLFRDGGIEAGFTIVRFGGNDVGHIGSNWFGADKNDAPQAIRKLLCDFCQFQDEAEIGGEKMICVSLLVSEGMQIKWAHGEEDLRARPLDRRHLVLPEVMVNSAEDADAACDRIEEYVWNAFGKVHRRQILRSENKGSKVRMRGDELHP